ncbi:putative ubiquitin-activating enzyme [Helianthus annuus]|uniref:Ubiquitin-activating enzyme n=1 Tax=Helianthus annuus TaxID=4232 RepID=A0A9K3J080_HELAN|nr:putative ubiquitin-activating enzyme [Helianthus annuus]KAJ0584709.1 putative ubiquitin-activating enzyme [Helianthus annuus]KAJ0750377.1 putative ubiquitin-activating enzyme [Helianthus annuus]KAJ0919113.1 putative ubiquitin-activating enzyme [Helianthus annuus]
MVGKKSSGGEEFNISAIGMGLEDKNIQDIDENLHSRQLAVYGRETTRRLFASNVLISGMQELGAEIGVCDCGSNWFCLVQVFLFMRLKMIVRG